MARPIALITGASSGLGATFARQLAVEGYDLILVARREAALQQLAKELHGNQGICATVVTADLTREEDVSRVCGLLAGNDRLELLVNNAGFGSRGFFFEADAEQQDAMHRLHVVAVERLTRAVLPGLVARARGGIINVASVAGFISGPGNISYCATKAWMVVFTEGLYLELKSMGSPVKVQALCPGYTYTGFHDAMGVDRSSIMGKGWWMSADRVVAESLSGFGSGKLLVIPGLRYKIVVAVARFLPRSLLIRGAARFRNQYAKR
jgi:short-subunit dehydrogenase